LLCEYYEAHWF